MTGHTRRAHAPQRSRIAWSWVATVLFAAWSLVGCAYSGPVENPLAELRKSPNSPAKQLAAMRQMDSQGQGEDEEYLTVLHRIVWVPGYNVQVREAAVDRLAEGDLENLKKTIRRHLPNMNALRARARLCEIIAERGWVDLTPALVSGWAVQIMGYEDERQRPEYQALVKLHGEERVPDVVFELFVESKKVSQQGLRTRCWELLHRMGYRQRLVDLLKETEPPEGDLLLADLHAGAVELGIVPHNREEILWMREIRQPEYAAFWREAAEAAGELDASRQAGLEMRDLAIIVSARRHAPELLVMSEAELYARLEQRLAGQKHYARSSTFGETSSFAKNRLRDWREELTWSDLAAMLIALRALDVPEVVGHLFDYAEHDRADETTEYGGIIQLDEEGRFEILEFPPRIRRHDQQFLASQAMMDAGYTALFHFHFHVQRARNEDYAGPGFGDKNYADNLRANCLVFTSVNGETMNVDYYRHGRVTVDLGVMKRQG